MNTIGFICCPSNNPPQEGNISSLILNSNTEILDFCIFQIRQLMIMGSKKSFGMNLGLHMLNNGSGNAHTIKGTGSTTYFIQNNQAIGGSVFENLSHLVHFHHKGTLTTNQIITGTYAGKNPVHRRNISLPGRYKAANLSHKHQQSSLPHIGRFTSHIRAGNQHNLTIIVI